MSVSLTANFFKNARGLTFKDSGTVTWTINKNTNEISATGSGGGGAGTVTSVGYSVNATYLTLGGTASPITTSGAFSLDLSTAAKANLALAATALQVAVTSVGLTVNATYIAIGGTASPITSTGTFTLDLSTAAKANLALAATALQVVPFTKAAGWNASSGAIVVGNTVPIDILIPRACTLKQVYIMTQGGTGSCTVTLKTAAFPSTPSADITSGVSPAISSGTSYSNSTLTSWTTSFAQGDLIRAQLTANTTFTSVTIYLRAQ